VCIGDHAYRRRSGWCSDIARRTTKGISFHIRKFLFRGENTVPSESVSSEHSLSQTSVIQVTFSSLGASGTPSISIPVAQFWSACTVRPFRESKERVNLCISSRSEERIGFFVAACVGFQAFPIASGTANNPVEKCVERWTRLLLHRDE
jgi:hypothetical protein